MADLAAAIADVRAAANTFNPTTVPEEASTSTSVEKKLSFRPRDAQSADDLKRELEEEFLTPSTKFSTEWLNSLQ
ncbi:hypothetical protein KEM55_002213, partial [Ascosphaera atra]